MVNLDRCNGSCNILDDPSSRICSKVEDVMYISNMTARMNVNKTLTKHLSCECKCKFDGRKFSSNLFVITSAFIIFHMCEKDCIRKFSTWACEND